MIYVIFITVVQVHLCLLKIF